MTCDCCETDTTDFQETVENEIELMLEEGADPLEIAGALMLSIGQLLARTMAVDTALFDMQVILNETAPILHEMEQEKGSWH